jgi:putative ABC transport system permease protein
MSYFAFLNILETGFLFGLVALGIYISFRVLAFPDMTVDGSFATGAAVAAALISKNGNPWLATALAVLVGMILRPGHRAAQSPLRHASPVGGHPHDDWTVFG